MDDSVTQSSESNTPKLGAPKDKNCPYCGQAFTSSSLGRHLDLYIKDKNPKPPDGIHDVDAIRKRRGGITRRQARASLGPSRDGSTPTSTPKPSATKKEGSLARDSLGFRSPAIPKDGQYAVDSTLSKYPFGPGWEATGVINDIPGKTPWEGDAPPDSTRRLGAQRNVSKQVVQKAQFDVKQKLSDAMDTARAAELALRELISSWRAAKQQFDNDAMPFDFDPLSLDFPALALQCLKPPPTLFSSTQHPTSTSWSVQSPGQREYGALQEYFEEEFRAWKIACATATTTTMEELTYPPTGGPLRDVRENVKRAEKQAENLEKQVKEHLQSAYTVWDSLPSQRRDELWVLELARGVGRKHKETEKLKAEQHKVSQENVNLKQQVDQLNRLQQPREFKMLSPTMIPIERELIRHAYEQGVKGGKSVGFDIEDRHADLGTLVTRSIERWKNVITSTRVSAGGMGAQKSLDQAGDSQEDGAGNASQSQNHAQTPQPAQRPQPKRLSTTSTNGLTSEQSASATTTAPPSIEEMSDQDADAEMEDDDSFAIMNPSPTKQLAPQPMQHQATLEVPRVRGSMQQQQQQQRSQDPRYMMPNGTASPSGRAAINLSRSMPNMNMAMQGNTALHGTEMGMTMQGVRGDPMYME